MLQISPPSSDTPYVVASPDLARKRFLLLRVYLITLGAPR